MRAPMAIARSADGRTFALARRSEIWIARIDGREASCSLLKPPPDSEPAERNRGREGPGAVWRRVALSPGADRLYLINGGDEFQAWALRAGPEADRIAGWDVPKAVTALALSADGRTLALGEPTGSIALVDALDGKALGRLTPPAGEAPGRVSSLAFAPSGDELAAGHREKVSLWRLGRLPAPLVRLPGHWGRVGTLAYDATGRYLATGGEDKAVAVWDLDRVRRELRRRDLDW